MSDKQQEWANEWRAARQEAERRVSDPNEGLTYDMEEDAFVMGAMWAREVLSRDAARE